MADSAREKAQNLGVGTRGGNDMRTLRLTLAWTEKAMAAHRARGGDPSEIPANDPFEGPVLDTDADTMRALEATDFLARLDKLPHAGMSLEDSHEEGWFDIDQLDALLAALELLLNEVSGTTPSTEHASRLVRWLQAALSFTQDAKRLQRGVCFWL
jgi:hypothetical protein